MPACAHDWKQKELALGKAVKYSKFYLIFFKFCLNLTLTPFWISFRATRVSLHFIITLSSYFMFKSVLGFGKRGAKFIRLLIISLRYGWLKVDFGGKMLKGRWWHQLLVQTAVIESKGRAWVIRFRNPSKILATNLKTHLRGLGKLG